MAIIPNASHPVRNAYNTHLCGDLYTFYYYEIPTEPLGSDSSDRKKKKKSRWGGSELEKTFIPGMPTVLPHNLTKEQEEAYICKYITVFFLTLL